ncbi:hypothetical protein G6F32_016759 [Rhizopus arrhizus]|nr:hypothetical protein G6F32_016759 [Rhizopus arrhizus]
MQCRYPGATHRIQALVAMQAPFHLRGNAAASPGAIMAKQLEELLYPATTHTPSGRDGTGRSSDGALDVQLSPPGSGKPGTNPEQLFAVGYSACFMGAMKRAGAANAIAVP